MRAALALALLAALALPAGANAAPAKISPRAAEVSAAGAARVEAANPNRYSLRGTATVTVGRRVLARRAVRLGRLSVTALAIRFDRRDRAALRRAGGRATFVLRLRRPGGRWSTTRRTVAFRMARTRPDDRPTGGAPVPAPPADGHTDGHTDGGGSPTPVSNRWAGRMGTEGAYDDLLLTVVDGQLQITRPPTVPVYCFENGGSNRSALSFELFDAPGPWTIGSDASVSKEGIAVNQLVVSGARAITYKVSGTAQQAGLLIGTLGMSFFDSRYDPFTNTITFVNCSGAQSFEAVPAD